MKLKNHHKLMFLFLIMLMASLACGLADNNNFEVAAAETVEAELTKLADQALSISLTEDAVAEPNIPVPISVSSETTVPTNTAIPTGTTIPTTTPTPTDSGPCDVASFVTDVTVYDGEDFLVGEAFTKIWRLKNVGSCTWTTAYDLVFFDGEQMGGPVSQPLFPSGSVAPNQTVDISVDLTAPLAGGNYTGFWKLRNASNEVFELSNGNPFYVNIDVFEPTETPSFPILIPIIPPLILISPDFTVLNNDVWTCFLSKRASFQIENIGAMTIESLEITVEGPIGNELYQSTQNLPFHPTSSLSFPFCGSIGNSTLAPGDDGWIYVSLATEPLPGITGRVTINVCSLDNLGGFCKEKTIDFIW